MQIRKRFAGVALAAALVGSVLGAPAAVAGPGGGDPYNAYCASGGNSGFQNTTSRTRSFAYVWRAGTTVLGSGSVRLAPGASTPAYTTPGGAEKFGVVTAGSATYAYVNC